MKELRKIDPLSLAKICGFFGLILGIIFSISLYFAGVVGGLPGWMLVLLPIGYGILYFVIGLVFSFIYNILAKNIGGIKLDT